MSTVILIANSSEHLDVSLNFMCSLAPSKPTRLVITIIKRVSDLTNANKWTVVLIAGETGGEMGSERSGAKWRVLYWGACRDHRFWSTSQVQEIQKLRVGVTYRSIVLCPLSSGWTFLFDGESVRSPHLLVWKFLPFSSFIRDTSCFSLKSAKSRMEWGFCSFLCLLQCALFVRWRNVQLLWTVPRLLFCVQNDRKFQILCAKLQHLW